MKIEIRVPDGWPPPTVTVRELGNRTAMDVTFRELPTADIGRGKPATEDPWSDRLSRIWGVTAEVMARAFREAAGGPTRLPPALERFDGPEERSAMKADDAEFLDRLIRVVDRNPHALMQVLAKHGYAVRRRPQ